uniref:Odorant receptor n=1 Tax=Glossina morsitans morsitans TaxID=37546 RepID=A0A1B0GDM4_GLOMM
MASNDYHGGKANILYSIRDSERLDNLFILMIKYLKLTGQIPLDLSSYIPTFLSPIERWFSRLYGFLVLFSVLHVALFLAKNTFDILETGELEQITDSLVLTMIYLFASFSSAYWMFRQKRLMELFQQINQLHRHHSLAGVTFVSYRCSYNLAHKAVKYWNLWCIIGVVFWALAPLCMGSHTLPLPCWYPFDALLPFIYELVYITQFWAQFNMGLLFGNGSALFVAIIIIVLGQFDVLYCSLKNLDSHALLMSGQTLKAIKDSQSLQDDNEREVNQYLYSTEYLSDLENLSQQILKKGDKSFKRRLHEALIECVHLHQFILKACDTLEELFNPFCLIKSLQVTFQLCLLVFVGVEGERSTVRIVNFLQYLCLTLVEFFLFAYFGEMLRRHSVRVGDALWRSRWWLNAHLIKRDVFIFLINSERAVKITAGKLFTMDLDRLRSVVTQAFSFLTLLQNMAEKQENEVA